MVTPRATSGVAEGRAGARRPCTRCRPATSRGRWLVGSGPATLRHPRVTAYRCFLPDLAGFTGHRRAGPVHRHHLARADPEALSLEREFNPAIADCGYRAPLAPRLAR